MLKKSILTIFVLVLVTGLWGGFFLLSSFPQSTETLTIVTYYPSPFGAYNQLRANKMVIGESDSIAIPSPDTNGVVVFKGLASSPVAINDTQPGALYYNNSDSEFKYYDGTGWQALGGSGCYVSYSGGCLSGFTNMGSAGCFFRPPGGGYYPGWSCLNIGQAYVCCR